MNFYENSCQEPPLDEALFGICDDQNGAKAYTDVNNSDKWIATVKNENHRHLVFTAIDKCVIKDHEELGRGRCDAMLTSTDTIYFIELKEVRTDWIQGAIYQLESTIRFFMDNHDITIYRYKKAFACNKKHPHFQEIDNELKLRFFRKYKVRIDIQAEIIVI